MVNFLLYDLKKTGIKSLRTSISRLTRLRKLILKHENQFNYAHVFGTGLVPKHGDHHDYEQNCDSVDLPPSLCKPAPTISCDTTACVGGWAYFQGRKDGVISKPRSRQYPCELHAASVYLGLIHDESYMLFYGAPLDEAGVRKQVSLYTSDVKVATRRIDACIRIRERAIASIKRDREKARAKRKGVKNG
jgi:hypothetical protein